MFSRLISTLDNQSLFLQNPVIYRKRWFELISISSLYSLNLGTSAELYNEKIAIYDKTASTSKKRL